MDSDRRRLVASLALSPLLGTFGPSAVFAGQPARTGRAYLGADAAPDGSFRFAAVGRDGEKVYEKRLPGRAHGFAIRSGKDEAVVFARRPGCFAVVFDLRDGTRKQMLHPPSGRHFYGHGVFSADGAALFTTENDFEAGRGMIGIWDARDGYRRVDEMPSHGIGPHELLMTPDGGTLIVANGGILTHPDFGRRKLNIPTMNPSLAYIEARNGALMESHAFEGRRQRLLSIRHIALNGAGTVCVALQDQGPRGDRMPLVAFHRRGEARLDLKSAPGSVTRGLHGYMGAVAMDSSGTIAAVSAPRGNLITFWDVERRKYLRAVSLRDGCGVAPDGTPNGFLATSGAGGAVCIDPVGGQTAPLTTTFVANRHWDNHLTMVVDRA